MILAAAMLVLLIVDSRPIDIAESFTGYCCSSDRSTGHIVTVELKGVYRKHLFFARRFEGTLSVDDITVNLKTPVPRFTLETLLERLRKSPLIAFSADVDGGYLKTQGHAVLAADFTSLIAQIDKLDARFGERVNLAAPCASCKEAQELTKELLLGK